MHYIDFFLLPLDGDKLEAYRTMASDAGKVWMDHGALAYKECILEDKTENDFCTSFPKVMNLPPHQIAVCAYILYKSREHRDEVNKKVMEDPRMKDCPQPENMPFNCKDMAYGGFQSIVDY